MEKRDVYRLHLIKTLDLPLTFSTYRFLRISLIWAWNIRVCITNIMVRSPYLSFNNFHYWFVGSVKRFIKEADR